MSHSLPQHYPPFMAAPVSKTKGDESLYDAYMEPSNPVTPSPSPPSKKKNSGKKKKRTKTVRFVASSGEEPFRQIGQRDINTGESCGLNKRNNRNDHRQRRSRDHKKHNGSLAGSSPVTVSQNQNESSLMCLGCITNGDLSDLMDTYNEALDPNSRFRKNIDPSALKPMVRKAGTNGQPRSVATGQYDNSSVKSFNFMSCIDFTTCTDIGFEMDTSSEEDDSDEEDELIATPTSQSRNQGQNPKIRNFQNHQNSNIAVRVPAKVVSPGSDQDTCNNGNVTSRKSRQQRKPHSNQNQHGSTQVIQGTIFSDKERQKISVNDHENMNCKPYSSKSTEGDFSEEQKTQTSVTASKTFIPNGIHDDGSPLQQLKKQNDFVYLNGNNDESIVPDWSVSQNDSCEQAPQSGEVGWGPKANTFTLYSPEENHKFITGGASLASLDYSDTDDGYGDRYDQVMYPPQQEHERMQCTPSLSSPSKRTFTV